MPAIENHAGERLKRLRSEAAGESDAALRALLGYAFKEAL